MLESSLNTMEMGVVPTVIFVGVPKRFAAASIGRRVTVFMLLVAAQKSSVSESLDAMAATGPKPTGGDMAPEPRSTMETPKEAALLLKTKNFVSFGLNA